MGHKPWVSAWRGFLAPYFSLDSYKISLPKQGIQGRALLGCH